MSHVHLELFKWSSELTEIQNTIDRYLGSANSRVISVVMTAKESDYIGPRCSQSGEKYPRPITSMRRAKAVALVKHR